MPRPSRTLPRSRLAGGGLLLVLVVAMAFSTKFLTPDEVAALTPQPFDPAATAATLFADAGEQLPAAAAPLGDVVQGIQTDIPKAAQTFDAVSPNDDAYVFPVTVTATVTEASGTALRLTVDGVPGETAVIVPLGTAVNGTVVRDVSGFVFADAPGQTDFQYVGDELKKLMLASIQQSVPDPAALTGTQVTVVGAVAVQATGSTVPKAKPVNVQPISIQAAP